MITVTAKAFHEKLHIEGDEIVLNGPPGFLTGAVDIRNQQEETLFVRELPLTHSEQTKSIVSGQRAFKLVTSLKAGEQKVQRVSYALPANTPPGNYESYIDVGGSRKKVRFLVQPNLSIDLFPLRLHFTGVEGGKSYETEISFTNNGNLPFRIPDIRHVNAFDEDYLCRAASMAIREKGSEGYIATMDALTKNVHREMAGWATVSIAESGRSADPGEKFMLHFKLILPENVDSAKDYFGSVRFWNKMINYNIKSQ